MYLIVQIKYLNKIYDEWLKNNTDYWDIFFLQTTQLIYSANRIKFIMKINRITILIDDLTRKWKIKLNFSKIIIVRSYTWRLERKT